jgi:predicted acyl esterase
VLQNYEGSVYFIHGLQDFNVDPRMISPAFGQLRDAGIEVKGLFGQWEHMYPDRPGEHCGEGANSTNCPSVRYDWAEDLLEWFDHYLKGTGDKPVLVVEVQDASGRWRVEQEYPPAAPAWSELALGSGTQQVTLTEGYTYDLPALDVTNDTLLGGHIYLDASITPSGANGQLVVRIEDAFDGRRIAIGTMDFRYREGTEPSPVVPNQPVTIRVETQPFDFLLPAGHALRLIVSPSGEGYQQAPSAAPYDIDAGASTVRFPVLHRDESVFFTPPAWSEAPGGDTGPST